MSIKSVKLLDDSILITIDEESKKESGIIIPDTAQQKSQLGTVIQVGPGKLDNSGNRIPLNIQSGEKIMFRKFAGTEITGEKMHSICGGDEKKVYAVIKSADVLFVF